MADNYPLKHVAAHYFTEEESTLENNHTTVPTLLRAIADWMDQQKIEDPEFQNLIIKTVFPVNHEDDFYQSATLYYLEEDSK